MVARRLLLHPHTALLAAALLPPLGYFLSELRLLGARIGFPLDDSWIHLQFARNLAAGLGLSFNPGELVTGSTAPLWTALVAPLFLVPGNIVFWTKLAGVAVHLGVVAATYRLARELDLGRGLSALAATLTLATFWLVWSALSGMEVSLFTLLSLWGMILHLRERRRPERPPLALGVLALSALARPEGVLLAGLAVADRLVLPQRGEPLAGGAPLRLARPPWPALARGLGLAALAVVPVVLFYTVVGGSPLPTTFGAKAAETRWWPNERYLYLVVGILFKPQPLTSLLAGAGIVRLAARLGGERDRGLLPALWVVGLPLAYSFMTPQGRHLLVGNFGRYFFPLFPVVIVLGILGLEPAARALGRFWHAGPVRIPVRALLLALFVAPTFATLINAAAFYTQNVANVQDSDVAMGRWMRANLPPTAVVAVQDIGAIKFFAPQRVVDLVGLVSPEIQGLIRGAMSAEDPLGERGVLEFLERTRPDFIVAYPTWHPNVTSDRARFLPLYRHQIPDNVTMAGPELVVYLTPWSRFRPPPGAP